MGIIVSVVGVVGVLFIFGSFLLGESARMFMTTPPLLLVFLRGMVRFLYETMFHGLVVHTEPLVACSGSRRDSFVIILHSGLRKNFF